MNDIEKAKKIVTETKIALVKYVIAEEKSVNIKNKLVKFIKESSSYDILHFVAKGSFSQYKTTPIKSLLESAIINRVNAKLNSNKSEIEYFTEACKSVLLSNYSANRKISNYIMKESSPYEICHLAMVGKFPTNYSNNAKQNLIESIARKIANKYGKTSFITEGFVHEIAGGLSYDQTALTKKIHNQRKEEEDIDDDSWVNDTEYIDVTGQPTPTPSMGDNIKQKVAGMFANKEHEGGTKLDYKPNSNPYTQNQGPTSFTSAATQKAVKAGENKFTGENPTNQPLSLKPNESHGILDRLQDLIDQGKVAGSQAMAQLQKTIGDNPDTSKAVGAVAAASLAIYGANKLYRKFLGNASKTAQGKPAPQAANILKNAKMKANQAKMADLQKSLSGCKSTKNPAKCQKLIQDKIKAARAKK